jgi:hypothetical protein
MGQLQRQGPADHRKATSGAIGTEGIQERFDENGNGYYDRKDFEPIWGCLDRLKQPKQQNTK